MNASNDGRMAVALLLVVATMPARAADPAFQAFFSATCPAAPGGSNLENVCLAAGTNISGDSESSLNPSQPLAATDQPLARAREKAAALHADTDEGAGPVAAEKVAQVGPFSLLVSGSGEWFDRDASGGERGYDGDSYGIELGLDRRLSDRALVGGFVTYAHTNVNFDADVATSFVSPPNAGGTDVNSGSLVIFGAYSLSDAAYLEAAAGYGLGDYEFRRNAVAQDSNNTFTIPVRTRGDSDGQDYWASVGGGYDVAKGAASYGLYGRVTWARSEIDGYREKDLNASGFALLVGDAKRTSLTNTLGVRASRAVSFDWGVLVPAVRVEYEHEFEDDPSSVTSAFIDVPGLTFSPARDDPDQDWFNLALGTQFILPGGLMPFFEAQARLGQRDVDRYQVVLGVRSEF